jgi:hypothetical protein
MAYTFPEIPEAVGPRADLYHDVREVRLAMEKEVNEWKAFEAKIQDSILTDLSVSENTGAAGLRYRAQVVTKREPTVEDWFALQKHIATTGEFDLMQKRLATTAIKDRWEADVEVPGVGAINVKSLSVTKI